MLEVKKDSLEIVSQQNRIVQNESKRKEIIDLENAIKSDENHLTADDFPLIHNFAPGVYAREIFLPQNSIVVGKIHKHSHLNILSYGHVIVATEEGNEEIFGPYTFTSPAGVKRSVFAVIDTLWTTIHLTNETDLMKIENEIISPSFEDFDLFCSESEESLKWLG